MQTSHRIVKALATLTLMLLIGSFGLAADISFDGSSPNSPGAGKIQGSGTYKLDKDETLLGMYIYAAPAGKGGGKGSFVKAMTDKGSWSGVVEKLANDTDYDVQVVLEYTDKDFNARAVFTNTVKVKTGK